jgi:hypothetical protein
MDRPVRISVTYSIGGTFVTDRIYNCTDSMPGYVDYLIPGHWVHSWKPIEYVTEIRTGRSMSEADIIKQGWRVAGLWCLWGAMIATSVAVALFASRTRRPLLN